MKRKLAYTTVYLDFKSIEKNDYRSVVRFFEKNAEELSTIDHYMWVDAKLRYICALFEIGAYSKFLILVDALIEELVIDNIRVHDTEDPFELLLYLKAACLFNTNQHEQSCKLLKQLIRINSTKTLYKQLYRKASLAISRPIYDRWRAIALLCILAVVPVSIMEMIVVDTLLPQYTFVFMSLRIGLLFLGISIFIIQWYLRRNNIMNELKSALN